MENGAGRSSAGEPGDAARVDAGVRPRHRLLARTSPRRRNVRFRLTAIYGGLFLLAGAILVVVTGILWSRATDGNLTIAATVPARILKVSGPVPRPLRADQKVPVARLSQPAETERLRAVADALQVVAHDQHISDLHQLLLYAGIAFGSTALLTIALGWLTAGRVLRPLRTITRRTKDISASNLHERLALSGPNDELHELGETIDQLLGRLERSFQAQRQFVANASHELRTPLATMRASLDVARAKPGRVPEQVTVLADRLDAELDQVDRLIESFLALARAQHGAQLSDGPVQLDHLVETSLEHRADAIAARALEVHAATAPGAWVDGDTTLLARMVENLIDNAVRHNEAGGSLSVRAEVGTRTARLVVENGGPVLDTDAVAELGQPFHRLVAERTGSTDSTGLGLSIVAAIAETHGGHLDLVARPEGGLRASVELPLAAPAPGGAPA